MYSLSKKCQKGADCNSRRGSKGNRVHRHDWDCESTLLVKVGQLDLEAANATTCELLRHRGELIGWSALWSTAILRCICAFFFFRRLFVLSESFLFCRLFFLWRWFLSVKFPVLGTDVLRGPCNWDTIVSNNVASWQRLDLEGAAVCVEKVMALTGKFGTFFICAVVLSYLLRICEH